MSFIKGIAKFISTSSLYVLSYLMLLYSGMLDLPPIPGLTVESIPTLFTIVIGIGSVASLISDGLKRAILQLLIEELWSVLPMASPCYSGQIKT